MASSEMPIPPRRRAEVAGLPGIGRRWAVGRPDVRGAALVGSWARDAPRSDSDVDLVLLTDNPAAYVDDEHWVAAFDAAAIVSTRSWGVVTERRAALASGLEVEFGVTSHAWASTRPLDAGTRRVASDGLVMLYDPDRLLATLVEAVAAQDS